MKKFIFMILILGIIIINSINNQMMEENKYAEFSKETQDWMKWYDSLSDEEKKYISYVPSELSEAIKNGYEYKIGGE